MRINIKRSFICIFFVFIGTVLRAQTNSIETNKLYSSKDFLNLTKFKNNLENLEIDFKTKVLNIDSLHLLESDAQIFNHKIIYRKFFKNFLNGQMSDNYGELQSSELEVDSHLFHLSDWHILPDSIKMDFPLTIESTIGVKAGKIKDSEYIILSAYPPCNGKACSNGYLIIIEMSSNLPYLYILSNTEAHPFYFDSLKVGSRNKNDNLELFRTTVLVDGNISPEYMIELYSVKNHKLVSLNNNNHKPYNIIYKCIKCSNDMRDEIKVVKMNWF